MRLLVWHETAGSYAGSISWLCNPKAEASAHIVIDETGSAATQLVSLAVKAWHAEEWNPISVGIEHANTLPRGYATQAQLAVSARVFGWLCLELGIPPRWARGGIGAGICRHGDLPERIDPHPQCGVHPDSEWVTFLGMVQAEIERGGYRKSWAQ